LAQTKSEGKPDRLPFVDGIRAVAALIVVLDHIYFEVFGTEYNRHPPYGFEFLSATMVLGHLSVAVFIVISGFVLTLPTVKHGMSLGPSGASGFFTRRARRILPAYYAALILTLALVATVLRAPTHSHFDSVKFIRPVDVVSHILLLQNVFGAGRINYVFWSIATECHIYLLYPLLLRAWRRWGGLAVVCATLLVGYGIQIGMGDNRITRAYVNFLGLFAMGMFAAAVLVPGIQRGRRQTLWVLRACVLVSVTIIAVMLCLFRSQNMLRWFPYLDFPAAIIAVWLLVEGCTEGGWIPRFFGVRPLISIGKYSYSLYLMHMPILAALLYVTHWLRLTGMSQFSTLCTIGTAVILTGTYGFYLLFEKPYINTPSTPAPGRPT